VSVRARFALTVALVVAVTVAVFAALSIAAMDRALRASVAARLRTAAQAVATTADYHHGRITIDADDLRTLSSIHADTPFAVFSAGAQVGGNPVPQTPAGLLTVTVPIVHRGSVVGSVKAWQSDLPIRDFERDAALVSIVLGALLITGSVVLALRVARSFETMLARIEGAYARERRFAGDASHELRAPLAVLRAETELALRRVRTAGEYRRALESIQRETGRLESLVEHLLAAARADADAHSRETLDAGALIRDLGERLRPAAAIRDVSIEVHAGGAVHIDANRAMVERALLAITDNAIAFAPQGGHVLLRAVQGQDGAWIEVADDGPGFTDEALEHATERFWRGDPSRPRGGTGLGLAIARTLLEANGATLRLANRAGGGAVVSARF
jgi:signal transduction histidine kinase/Cu/Ag efflux protein CusF